jgi:hypothetical protein
MSSVNDRPGDAVAIELDFSSILLSFLASVDVISKWFQVYVRRANISQKQILEHEELSMDDLRSARKPMYILVGTYGKPHRPLISDELDLFFKEAVKLMQWTNSKEPPVLDVRHAWEHAFTGLLIMRNS